jgi:hypothetical protein
MKAAQAIVATVLGVLVFAAPPVPNVPTAIVPLRFVFADGHVMDPGTTATRVAQPKGRIVSP